MPFDSTNPARIWGRKNLGADTLLPLLPSILRAHRQQHAAVHPAASGELREGTEDGRPRLLACVTFTDGSTSQVLAP